MKVPKSFTLIFIPWNRLGLKLTRMSSDRARCPMCCRYWCKLRVFVNLPNAWMLWMRNFECWIIPVAVSNSFMHSFTSDKFLNLVALTYPEEGNIIYTYCSRSTIKFQWVFTSLLNRSTAVLSLSQLGAFFGKVNDPLMFPIRNSDMTDLVYCRRGPFILFCNQTCSNKFWILMSFKESWFIQSSPVLLKKQQESRFHTSSEGCFSSLPLFPSPINEL